MQKLERCELFGSRDSLQHAINFAIELARSEGMPEIVMHTAIMVYHNTLINLLEKDKEKENASTK